SATAGMVAVRRAVVAAAVRTSWAAWPIRPGAPAPAATPTTAPPARSSLSTRTTTATLLIREARLARWEVGARLGSVELLAAFVDALGPVALIGREAGIVSRAVVQRRGGCVAEHRRQTRRLG